MGSELIKRENFEIAKKNIEQFARNLPSAPSFNRVEIDGGLFGWGNHKVTGSELNRFIGAVQNKLIDINTSLRSTISEFKEVYATFEVLDREYISGIIATAEEAERAGNKALQAQKDTQKTVDNLSETVKYLASLKDRVDKIEKTIVQKSQTTLLSYFDIVKNLNKDYKISQIPAINNTIRTIQESNTSFFKTLSTTIREVNEINNQVNSLIDNVNKTTERVNSDIASLQEYRSALEAYKHLGDVDTIWSDVQRHKADLKDFHIQVDSLIDNVNKTTECVYSDIASLQEYRSALEAYKHLGDVDTIWSDVQGHKADLKDFHIQVDSLIDNVNKTTERINSDIASLQGYRSALEAYKHLGDVDTIWSDVQRHKADLKDFHIQVDSLIDNVNKTTECVYSDIASLQEYRSALEAYKHLGDVDTIWSDVQGHKADLKDFHIQVDSLIDNVNKTTERINSDIASLQGYRSALEAYKHLGDVDTIWSDVQGHKADLKGIHEQVDAFISEVHSTESETKDSIRKMQEENSSAHLLYEKRIKIAYGLGCTGIVVSIINLILQIVGVL